jgi:hypothetical protein
VVIVGTLENEPVDVLPGAFIIREIRLLGSRGVHARDLEICLR